jgi:hypothetical protein
MNVLPWLFLLLIFTGCDNKYFVKSSNKDYELAQSDCAAHGGLIRLRTKVIVFEDSRVRADCDDGTVFFRPSKVKKKAVILADD